MSEPIETRLEPAYDEERIAASWQRIAEVRDRKSLPRRGWLVAVPVFAAAAAVIAVVVLRRAPEQPAALASTDMAVEPGAEIAVAVRTPVALDDGSQLVLDPGARMQVLTNDGTRFTTLLEHGTIVYDVKPGGPRRWEIETSLATVEVVGTRFVVAHDGSTLTVSVERGVVMVRGERITGRVQRLTAGQHIVVGAITASADVHAADAAKTRSIDATNAQADNPRVDDAARSIGASDPSKPDRPNDASNVRADDRRPNDASNVRRDRPNDASNVRRDRPNDAKVRSADQASDKAVRATVPATRGPADGSAIARAIADADRLRPVDPGRAADVLERAIADHPDDAASGLAAFTLGRLYQDTGQPGRAAELFRRIVNRGNPRTLLEDAYARLVETLLAGGDRDGARQALVELEAKYPDSARAVALRRRVGP